MKKRMMSVLIAFAMLIPFAGYAEDSADTDWYMETADALCGKLQEVVSFDGFAEFYTASEEIAALIDSWNTAMDVQPKAVGGYPLPTLSMISEFVPGLENAPDALIEKMERSMAALLVTQINATEGVNFLAASNIPTLSEGYVMPENFEPCIIVYEYEGICVCVSFVETGEGVIGATVQFASPQIAELLTAQ